MSRQKGGLTIQQRLNKADGDSKIDGPNESSRPDSSEIPSEEPVAKHKTQAN